jgi:hypothetical protein
METTSRCPVACEALTRAPLRPSAENTLACHDVDDEKERHVNSKWTYQLRGNNRTGIGTRGITVLVVVVLAVLAFFGVFGLHLQSQESERPRRTCEARCQHGALTMDAQEQPIDILSASALAEVGMRSISTGLPARHHDRLPHILGLHYSSTCGTLPDWTFSTRLLGGANL